MTTYAGYLLRANLSSGAITREPIPVNRQEKFIGGRGFGISYLLEEMQGGLDPLGEDNKLMFMPGVLAGTAAQGFGRWIVMTKSPLTGGLALQWEAGISQPSSSSLVMTSLSSKAKLRSRRTCSFKKPGLK